MLSNETVPVDVAAGSSEEMTAYAEFSGIVDHLWLLIAAFLVFCK